MAHETNMLAPWAELAPQAEPMTVDDLLALPDDGWMYELVDGRLVRMPGGGEASLIGINVAVALQLFVKPRTLGRVTGADGTFDLTQPGDTDETALAPDVAFVRADRVPPRNSPEYTKAWKLAPDLVVEVASPSQFRPEMQAKAERYIKAGVQLLWIIWPKSQTVDVWRPDAAGAPQLLTTLTASDNLDGLDVLLGFTHPVADLFA